MLSVCLTWERFPFEILFRENHSARNLVQVKLWGRILVMIVSNILETNRTKLKKAVSFKT